MLFAFTLFIDMKCTERRTLLCKQLGKHLKSLFGIDPLEDRNVGPTCNLDPDCRQSNMYFFFNAKKEIHISLLPLLSLFNQLRYFLSFVVQ